MNKTTKVDYEKFTGSIAQKMFAADIINRALESIERNIKDVEYVLINKAMFSAENIEYASVALAAYLIGETVFQQFISGKKKYKAKLIIEMKSYLESSTKLGNYNALDMRTLVAMGV